MSSARPSAAELIERKHELQRNLPAYIPDDIPEILERCRHDINIKRNRIRQLGNRNPRHTRRNHGRPPADAGRNTTSRNAYKPSLTPSPPSSAAAANWRPCKGAGKSPLRLSVLSQLARKEPLCYRH